MSGHLQLCEYSGLQQYLITQFEISIKFLMDTEVPVEPAIPPKVRPGQGRYSISSLAALAPSPSAVLANLNDVPGAVPNLEITPAPQTVGNQFIPRKALPHSVSEGPNYHDIQTGMVLPTPAQPSGPNNNNQGVKRIIERFQQIQDPIPVSPNTPLRTTSTRTIPKQTPQ